MLDAIEFTALCIAVLGTCLGSFATTYLVYRRLILKCFSPFFAGLMVFVLYAATFLYGTSMAKPQDASILASFGLPMLAVLPLLALPSLNHRRAVDGRTYFPFRLVGGMFLALAAMVLVAYIQAFDIHQFNDMLKIIGGLASAGIYMFWLYRRSLSRETVHTWQKAEIGQVLFLRSFKRDIDLFIPSAPDHLLHLASNPMTRASAFISALQSSANPGLTFEEFFSAEMKKWIGPLVALGSPEDYLPPVGAARTYVPDDDWQAKLAAFAKESALIVMEPDESTNLSWELQYLRTHALHEKLVVVIRPPMAVLNPWGFLYWFSRYVRWARGIRETQWPAFVTMMAGFGYKLDSQAPPPGAVFGFDAQGGAILLTSFADTPEDYVAPLAQWASARAMVGRHVRLACSRCANGWCYRLSQCEAPAMPALCHTCTEDVLVAGLDGMRRFGRAILRNSMLLYTWIFTGLGIAIGSLIALSQLYLRLHWDLPAWLGLTLFCGLPCLFWLLPVWWPHRKPAS